MHLVEVESLQMRKSEEDESLYRELRQLEVGKRRRERGTAVWVR